jgi:CelD/BcsL family acetyltransferase involved in cellulose biosynthesis
VTYFWPKADLAAPVAPGFALQFVTTRAAFDALGPEWNDLFGRAGRDTQLFQTFNWNWHWANHYLPHRAEDQRTCSLAIVAGRLEGRLVMLWPLVLERTAGLAALRWMGEPVSQYGDVLLEDVPGAQELLQQAWRAILARLGADVLHLRKVRADAVVGPLLRQMGMAEVARAEAPFLDLASAPDFATYDQRYGAKARKNRRRLMRRLTERGDAALERHTVGPEAAAAARQALALKQAWIRTTGRLSPALADARFAAFFADAAEGRGRPAGCGVTVLKSMGVPAALGIDLTCAGRRAAHVIVHDPQLEAFSPGTLLLQEWVRGACGDGVATFDLLAPAYAYKLDWADGSVGVGDYALGITPAGRLYARLYLGLVRERLKAAADARGLLRRLRKLWASPWPARRQPA